MKKFLSLVIALALLFCSAALASCGSKIYIINTTASSLSVSAEPTRETTSAESTETTAEATTDELSSEAVSSATAATTASASITESSAITASATTASATESTVESREPTGISLDYLTTPIKINAKATVRIKGKPDTEYKISVFYSSAASTAKGLEAKISDGDGMVSWTWKVGARTKEGEYRIVISGGGETFTTYFRVTH